MASPDNVTVGGVTYRVTPEYVAAAAADTSNTAVRIDGQLDTIRSYVYSLEAEWRGMAHDRFVVLMAEYDRLAQMLRGALDGIASGLQGNYANYTGSENANVTNLNQIQAAMPGGHQGPTAKLT